MLGTEYQVNLPIAQPLFRIDNRRPLLNANAVFNRSSGIGLTIAFSTLFLTMTQVTIQRTAYLTIGANVLINTLYAQAQTRIDGQATGNLLGTPLSLQIRFNLANNRRRHLDRFGLRPATLQRVLMGLAGDGHADRDCAGSRD